MSIESAKIHLANANRHAGRQPYARMQAALAQAHALIEIHAQLAEQTKLTTDLLAEIRDRITPEEADQ